MILWHHRPLAHVLLFFILFGIATVAGIMSGTPVAGLATGTVLGIAASVIANTRWEDPSRGPAFPSSKDIFDRLEIYVDGKMKRYTLLFAVNGGAFAIVELLSGPSKTLPGRLTFSAVATGAVVFTAVMTVDIWMWGHLMRRKELAGASAFTPVGRSILLLIAALIISGWVLAAMPRAT